MQESVDIDTRKEIIKKQSVFSQLTEGETAELAAILKEKKMIKGETIVKEGDTVDSVYLIVEGEVDVRQIFRDDGNPTVKSIATLHPGQAIGLNESGFFSLTGKRTATVIANTDVTLLALSIPLFHGFALAYPHVSEIMRKNAQSMLGIFRMGEG